MKRKENIYDKQYRNAGKQLCREIFGTDNLEELRSIAEKAEKYDLILQTSRPGNIRGAGRKAKFTAQELQEIYALHEEGAGVSKIANRFGVSRQTIYKYLAARLEEEREHPTLRINYMEEYTVCSVIDVDEKKRSVTVTNRVPDYSRCAFGAMEQPTWEAFEWFLESRCFSRDASDAEEKLKELGLTSYKPLEILEKTKGRLATDHHWLQIIYFDTDWEKKLSKSKEVLKKYFGYEDFREGQETLVDSILQGKDTFGIMPTGAGKSICYQVPALMLEGITLVISPLISLMKDRVSSLNQAGIHAAYLNSSLTPGQYRTALSRARQGQYKIIYVAPERLLTPDFLEFAANVGISMVTVDEAHCISQWGQDFRPSYLKIVEFIERLSVRPIVSAFTATATKEVREDIVCVLGLREPTVLVTGFDRKNLYYEVQMPKNKEKFILDYVQEHAEESGIIYCLTRKLVDELYEKLESWDFPVARYHAGMTDEERRRNQEDFIYDFKPIMIATNAFGMGIDKSNVRYVVHYNMPKNMESYYQEAGRAGRDGAPARCILLYEPRDVVLNQFLIEKGSEREELSYAEKEALLERDAERLRKMTYYCLTSDCLRDYILRYFGEFGGNYCGNCKNCLTVFEDVDVTEIARKLIGCVQESGQRFGMSFLIDIVHGADTARIRQNNLKKNSFYGSLSSVPVYKLRQVFQHLLMQEYLMQTDGEYAVIKLTEQSLEVLGNDSTVIMKMAKEEEKTAEAAEKKSRRKQSGAAAELDAEEQLLFERLRALRMEIAKEEHVPPYVVFSDKTLAQMSALRPKTREEMLSVSGVGEHKLEKYGGRFMECIARESLSGGRKCEDGPERRNPELEREYKLNYKEEQKKECKPATQLIVDLYGCPESCIDDVDYIRDVIHKICDFIHAGIVEECYHKFEPIGISAVAVITTSHMSIHTWPEYGYAAVDIFSCTEEIPEKVCRLLTELLQAEKSETRTVERKLRIEP